MRPRILLHQGCGCGCGGHGGSDLNGSRDWAEAPDDAHVCPCLGVTKAQVIEAIEMGAFTVPLVKAITGLGQQHDCDLGHQCMIDLQVILNLFSQGSMQSKLQEKVNPAQK